MCFGSLQSTCRLFQENKAQLAVSKAFILAFDSFNTGGLENVLLILPKVRCYITNSAWSQDAHVTVVCLGVEQENKSTCN